MRERARALQMHARRTAAVPNQVTLHIMAGHKGMPSNSVPDALTLNYTQEYTQDHHATHMRTIPTLPAMGDDGVQ